MIDFKSSVSTDESLSNTETPPAMANKCQSGPRSPPRDSGCHRGSDTQRPAVLARDPKEESLSLGSARLLGVSHWAYHTLLVALYQKDVRTSLFHEYSVHGQGRGVRKGVVPRDPAPDASATSSWSAVLETVSAAMFQRWRQTHSYHPSSLRQSFRQRAEST